jgi:hypothetical protein
MNRCHRRTLAAMLLASLAACQSMGNGRAFTQSDTQRSQTLKIGITTRDDARRELGDAIVYDYDDGSQAWSYQTTTGIPKWVGFLPYLSLLPIDYADRTTELELLFDPRGILRKMEWRPGQTKASS